MLHGDAAQPTSLCTDYFYLLTFYFRPFKFTNLFLLLFIRYLRHDGLPIVNVQNATYPNYTWVDQPIDYEINFLSDSLPHRLTIHPRENSLMVFGAAFLMEESTKIQQDVSFLFFFA